MYADTYNHTKWRQQVITHNLRQRGRHQRHLQKFKADNFFILQMSNKQLVLLLAFRQDTVSSTPDANCDNVTSKPEKKDSNMKIDKTTYKDKEENQIGLTANHTSQPDKVLFFADPHFLFFKPDPQMAHCLLPDTQAIASQKSKSHFSLRTKRVNLQIQTLKLNSYGNN